MPIKKTALEKSPLPQPSNLLIILLIVVSFFAGYLFFKVKSLEKGNGTGAATQQALPQGQQPAPAQTVSLDNVKKLFTTGYIHFGDANKKVLIMEITDPSCPFCHVAGGQNPELAKQMNSNFQYITDGGTYDPPVTEIKKLVDDGKASYAVIFGNGHGNGLLGMQALYCAFDKGKYWEVHSKLMSNAGYDLLNNKVLNDKKNIPQLVDFLSDAIDSGYLSDCLTSAKYEKTLARDQQLDPTFSFQGTPHFIVNTTIYGGAVNYKNGMEANVNNLLSN